MRSTHRTGRPETGADVRDAVTVAVAVGVVGVSFGALAPAAGLSPGMTMAMSLLVFAGGAQLLVTGVLAAGGGIWAAVAAGLVLNLRHLPFGLALARHLGTGWSRVPGAHVITDESTAFVLARTGGTSGRARRAFWILGVAKYACWQLGTAGGLLLGASVPDPSALGLDAAFPAALLALLVPVLRAVDAQRVAVAAATIALACAPFLPAGLPVLAGMLGVGAAGRTTGTGRPDAAQDGAGAAAGGVGTGAARNGAGAAHSGEARQPGRCDGPPAARCGDELGRGSGS